MKQNLRGIWGLLDCLKREWLFAVLGLLCCAVADGVQLLVPMVAKVAMDALEQGRAEVGLLQRQGLILVVLALVAYTVRYGWRYFMFTAARRIEQDLRRDIYHKAIRVPLSTHYAARSGDTMSLVTNDLMSVRMALAFGLMSSFDALAYSAMSILAMFALDAKLALLCLIPYPFLGLVMLFLMDKNYKTWDKVQKTIDDLTEKSRESIAGMRVLRAYSQEQGDQADFMAKTEAVYSQILQHVRWDAIYEPSITLAGGLSAGCLLFVGGSHVIAGRLTLGGFTAFTSYLGQLAWPMIAAGWTMAIVQRAAASMARIQTLLDKPEDEGGELARPLTQETNQAGLSLKAHELSFSYPSEAGPVEQSQHGTVAPLREALSQVSFCVEAGQSLGVVGEIGSGKSTLCQLLLGFYPVAQGMLEIGGRDLNQWLPSELRSQVGWVSQDAFLFSDTILGNLNFPQASVEADQTPKELSSDSPLRRAAEDAALHAEVGTFEMGYATLLGERGVTLSGGQKQRLTLARAFLREARLLILDDTLSAVDSQTERHILQALRARVEGRTSVIVSHRVSSVEHCDLILVLQNGQVIQRGTHSSLLQQPGFYADLYRLQNGAAASPEPGTVSIAEELGAPGRV